jgi:hypothetical protein
LFNNLDFGSIAALNSKAELNEGLAALRRDEWVAGIPGGLNTVHVSVANVRVDYEVKMADFERWLEKPGKSPREVVERQRIRAILGMEVSR